MLDFASSDAYNTQNMEKVPKTPKEQGLNFSHPILSEKTQNCIETKIGDYTLTVDSCLTFAANASLIGLQDKTGEADLWARRVDEVDIREHYPDSSWFFEFVSNASRAKMLGHEVEISDTARKLIQKKTHGLTDWQFADIQNAELNYWQFITKAKILGFEVDSSKSASRVKQCLEYFDKWIETHYEERWNKDERDDLRAHYGVFGGQAAGFAQARIHGINVTPSEFMTGMIEKTIKMAETDDAIIFIPQMAADLAIIKAKEVKVGGPRGLELIL